MEEIMNDIAIKPRSVRKLINEGKIEIKDLVNYAISSQNPDYILNMALFTNSIRLASELIKIGNLDYLLILAKDENTSNKIRMFILGALIASNNPRCIFWAAKHIVASNKKLSNFLEQFEDIIGLDYIKCIHINDSKNEVNSHKDRHANIGFGTLGFDTIYKIVHALIELRDDMYMFLAHRDIVGGPDEEIKFALEEMQTPYKVREDDAKRIYKPAFKSLKKVS